MNTPVNSEEPKKNWEQTFATEMSVSISLGNIINKTVIALIKEHKKSFERHATFYTEGAGSIYATTDGKIEKFAVGVKMKNVEDDDMLPPVITTTIAKETSATNHPLEDYLRKNGFEGLVSKAILQLLPKDLNQIKFVWETAKAENMEPANLKKDAVKIFFAETDPNEGSASEKKVLTSVKLENSNGLSKQETAAEQVQN